MDKKLLYLEDDQALASVTKRALERRGFQVHHCASLHAVAANLACENYTHALLDLKIGQETSMPVLQTLAEKSAIPVVILTGYGTVRVAVQAMKLGAVNVLTKPCGADEIIAAFEEINTDTAITQGELAKPSLKAVEWEAIQKALDENAGNVSAAARQLKMHRRTLQRKLNKRHLDIDP